MDVVKNFNFVGLANIERFTNLLELNHPIRVCGLIHEWPPRDLSAQLAVRVQKMQ